MKSVKFSIAPQRWWFYNNWVFNEDLVNSYLNAMINELTL